jgi:hypothetical protein
MLRAPANRPGMPASIQTVMTQCAEIDRASRARALAEQEARQRAACESANRFLDTYETAPSGPAQKLLRLEVDPAVTVLVPPLTDSQTTRDVLSAVRAALREFLGE